MKRAETARILSILTRAYPNFFTGQSETEVSEWLDLWTFMFEEYDYNTVAIAVKGVLATEKYPPSIATVMEKIRLITQQPTMNEGEAWALVKKAVSNSLYNSVSEFKKLPESVQKIVCTPEQLASWSTIDVNTFDTVVASNFKRAYKAEAERQAEIEALPSSVRQGLESGKYLGA